MILHGSPTFVMSSFINKEIFNQFNVMVHLFSVGILNDAG